MTLCNGLTQTWSVRSLTLPAALPAFAKHSMVNPSQLHDAPPMQQFSDAADGIAEHYEHGNFGKAVREITALADLANQYIASHEPWNMVKDPERKAEVQPVCCRYKCSER